MFLVIFLVKIATRACAHFFKSSRFAIKGLIKSIRNCFAANLASAKAYQAKQVDEKNCETLFHPQSGNLLEGPPPSFSSDFAENLQMVSEQLELVVPDHLVTYGERSLALMLTLRDCRTYTGMISAIFMFLTSNNDMSITKQVRQYVVDLLRPGPQSGTETDDVDPDWLVMLRSCKDQWGVVKNNVLFEQFSKLLGLLVVANICDSSDVTFEIGKFKLLEPDLKTVHANAFDVADAAFGTVMYFVENTYASWKAGSIYPLLVGSQEAIALDEEYSKVVLWWKLVQNGNLHRVANVSDQEFDRRLEALLTKLRALTQAKKSSYDKKLIQDKFMRLLSIKNDYITLKIASGVRRAPFALEFFGESSQGKTTCADQVVDALLTSAGLPIGKEYRSSVNAGDKYMSNWGTNKLVMQFDDMANEKSDHVERPPTRAIIDVCNNQPYYANMADLDSKGKVFVEPHIVTVSTNRKNLDANQYSNCPYSIQRRMHNVITVKAKKQFQIIVDGQTQGIDSNKVRLAAIENDIDAPFDDIWEFTVERAIQPAKLTSTATYGVVKHRGKEMKQVGMKELVNFLIEEFQAHRVNQDHIVNAMAERKELKICPHDGCNQVAGYCLEHDFEKQVGLEDVRTILQKRKNIFLNNKSRVQNEMTSMIEFMKTMHTLNFWLTLIPTSFVSTNLIGWLYIYLKKDEATMYFKRLSLALWSLTLCVCVIGTMVINTRLICPFYIILFLYALAMQKKMVNFVYRRFHARLINQSSIAPLIDLRRSYVVNNLIKSASVLGVLYLLGKAYRTWCSFKQQGSLEPKTPEQIEERDREINPWTGTSQRELPVDSSSKTTTSEQLQNRVLSNLYYGTIVVDGDRKLMANGLYIDSNAVIIPTHYFEKNELDVTFRHVNPETTGGKFAVRISKDASVQIPNTDLSLCYSSSGGSMKNLISSFPLNEMPAREFDLLWRKKDGTLVRYSGMSKPKMTSNGVCRFQGGEYSTLTGNTFKGLCGATLVSRGGCPTILGLHLGGKDGTARGCYGSLTQNQLLLALEQLRKLEGVVITGSGEQFTPQVLDVQMLTNEKLHTKSPVRYLPQDSQVAYFGSCKGRTTSKSDVEVTPISEIVMDVTGQPNIWGPPKMNPQWFGWQTCLANMAVPAKPFPYDLLKIAIVDYKEDLLNIFRSPLWKNIGPLSDVDNLSGIDGLKFVDAINLSTSIGYPLSGPKRDFVIETTDETGRLCREFTPEIIAEIKRVESFYKRGERAYTVAKGCVKDEVLAKSKCRIFYGNPISLTFCIRKYFLPLIRVLQMNPLVSECAVGINSHGPEWHEFDEHVRKFGNDRLIGGDYGKYDQKLTSQLLLAALRILIDFARECNYSDEDIRAMEAMCGDLVFALIAFNGDLIGLLEGGHISGNSLTVILNGICGSLNLRVVFYTLMHTTHIESRKKFREHVKLMTYGDDNIGSVSPNITNFTIKNISHILAQYGQIYTMPDKESELLDFLPPEEFEFLKRKTVYHPKLGFNIGALVEKSIFKMLHCYMRPKGTLLTPEHACGMNVDTALREWFNHGEEVYERRRKQMIEVCEKAGITHLCTQLFIGYDEKVAEWREKYDDTYLSFSEPVVPTFDDDFEAQCGEELTVYTVDYLDHCQRRPGDFYSWESYLVIVGMMYTFAIAYLHAHCRISISIYRVPKTLLKFLFYMYLLGIKFEIGRLFGLVLDMWNIIQMHVIFTAIFLLLSGSENQMLFEQKALC